MSFVHDHTWLRRNPAFQLFSFFLAKVGSSTLTKVDIGRALWLPWMELSTCHWTNPCSGATLSGISTSLPLLPSCQPASQRSHDPTSRSGRRAHGHRHGQEGPHGSHARVERTALCSGRLLWERRRCGWAAGVGTGSESTPVEQVCFAVCRPFPRLCCNLSKLSDRCVAGSQAAKAGPAVSSKPPFSVQFTS